MNKNPNAEKRAGNPEPIPSHFFKKGDYEVWAAKSYDGGAPIVLIAANLCLETAKAFNWPYKEIRLNGKVVKP